jgi:hypothetical protein
MNPWVLWPFLWGSQYLFESYPLLVYSLIALIIRRLFSSGLLLLLPLAMIAFKRRYTWERNGFTFSVRIALLVLLLCPWSFVPPKRTDFVRMTDTNRSDDLDSPKPAWSTLSISPFYKWHLSALSFYALQLVYV